MTKLLTIRQNRDHVVTVYFNKNMNQVEWEYEFDTMGGLCIYRLTYNPTLKSWGHNSRLSQAHGFSWEPDNRASHGHGLNILKGWLKTA